MKKKLLILLAGFFILMLLFTILSRAADSMGIAKVTVQKPENRVIEHGVKGSGKVMQKREVAVSTEQGQVVKTIFVEEGSQVEAGTPLFEVDLEDLELQILQAKQELEKLKLQAKDAENGQSIEASKKATDQNRASQDYNDAAANGNEAVQKAQEELDLAKAQLAGSQDGQQSGGADSVLKTLRKTKKEKEDAYDKAKKELDVLKEEVEAKIKTAIQEAAVPVEAMNQTESADPAPLEIKQSNILDKREIEAQIRLQYKQALKQAELAVEKAEKEKKAAVQAVEAYEASLSNQASQAAQTSKQQMEQAVAEKQAALDAALKERDENLKAAGRLLEDAKAPAGSQSTKEINAIDIAQKELSLSKLEKLKAVEGKIYAPVKGSVTKVALTTGDRTPDGTAVLLADLSSGTKLVVQVPIEKEKYVSRKAPVTIKPSGNGKEITGLEIDTVKVNELDNSTLDISVNLPPDTLEIGTTAELNVDEKAETYPLCIPVSALYQEQDGSYYVLIVQDKETVLGTERIAKRHNITVVDKNETYAALEDGSISPDSQVIVGSEKSIEADSRVRLIEQ